MKMQTASNDDGYASTLQAAFRYQVGPEMLRRWREQKGFPDDAVQRRGAYAFWHIPSIDKWLRERLVRKAQHSYGTGPRPRWADVVERTGAQ